MTPTGHYIDKCSWKHGKHDIKFGYEFRRTTVSQIFDSYFRGRLKFSKFCGFSRWKNPRVSVSSTEGFQPQYL